MFFHKKKYILILFNVESFSANISAVFISSLKIAKFIIKEIALIFALGLLIFSTIFNASFVCPDKYSSPDKTFALSEVLRDL